MNCGNPNHSTDRCRKSNANQRSQSNRDYSRREGRENFKDKSERKSTPRQKVAFSVAAMTGDSSFDESSSSAHLFNRGNPRASGREGDVQDPDFVTVDAFLAASSLRTAPKMHPQTGPYDLQSDYK